MECVLKQFHINIIVERYGFIKLKWSEDLWDKYMYICDE